MLVDHHVHSRGITGQSSPSLVFPASEMHFEATGEATGKTDTLEEASDRYRHGFGWNTEVVGTVVQVHLCGAVAAFIVRPGDIAGVSRYIGEAGDPCVALRLPGRTPSIVVLVDARDHVAALDQLPVGLFPFPTAKPLPLPPSHLPEGNVEWLSRPDMARRWLPNAATLLAAVHRLRRSGPYGAVRRIEPRDRLLMMKQWNGRRQGDVRVHVAHSGHLLKTTTAEPSPTLDQQVVVHAHRDAEHGHGN
ncbi:hypothetical protein [Lentzea roselyniae]